MTEYQLPEPKMVKQYPTGLIKSFYTADQMQAAYQAGEDRLRALLTSQSSAYDSGYQAGREAMRQECAEFVVRNAGVVPVSSWERMIKELK